MPGTRARTGKGGEDGSRLPQHRHRCRRPLARCRHLPRTIAVRFPNTAAGHRDLLAWPAPRRVERIACEASGGSERGLAELVEARRQLLDALTTARNQTAAARLPRLRAMAAARIDQLRAWIKELDTAIAEQIAAHAPLARANALLRSVPGVGPATAARLLADIPELGSPSRQKVAALAGVAPFANDSGQRQGKRRMRAGRREVRCALYMAALSTTRHNPLFRPVYTRLVANGKPPKVAIGALMRKLLVTLNAILRTGQPWRHNADPIAA